MDKSKLGNLDWKDAQRGLVMAVIMGVLLPVAPAVQTPGFDIFTANWSAIASLAVNGAVTGFIAYVMKNFVSDSEGRVFGKI